MLAMKLVALVPVLALLVLFSNGEEFLDDASGMEPLVSETTTNDPNLATASIGSFLVEDDEGKKRLCTCSEVQRCSFVHSTDTMIRDECGQQCASNLADIDTNTTTLLDCFHENYMDELKAGEVCIRSQHQNLCSNYRTDKKVSNENWALNALQFDQPLNPLHRSNVYMLKAEKVYSSIRKYQHCFNSCIRQKEFQCREGLKCAANYPNQQEVENMMTECPSMQQTAYDNARIACKCLIAKKNIVKLVGLCSLFIEQFMVRV